MSKKGIDVSKHNGSVDYNAVKKAGHGDFVIIRCGVGGDFANQDDTKFIENVKACEKLSIPYGIYLYSYAMNVEQAISESAHALRLAKQCGANFKYGIWFDMEDADNYKKNKGMPSNNTLVDICYTFCNIVEQTGYHTGIYASLSWLNNQLSSSKLDRFDKWVAQWNSNAKSSYPLAHSIWQNSSSLVIGGKRFDSNILVRDFAIPFINEVQLSSTDIIAKQVIDGEWGNGDDRKANLTRAGYNYSEVQAKVNSLLKKPSVSYYPVSNYKGLSLVDGLTKIGVNNSFSYRKAIAIKNGITNYTGTPTQNSKLLNLLKSGKLIRIY